MTAPAAPAAPAAGVHNCPVRVCTVSVYTDWRDWWVGLYVGPDHLYVCLLPCVVIRLRRQGPACPPSALTNVPDSKLMCYPHRAMVPRRLQAAVYRAYNRGSGLGSTSLHAAQLAAVSAVNDVLHSERTTGNA